MKLYQELKDAIADAADEMEESAEFRKLLLNTKELFAAQMPDIYEWYGIRSGDRECDRTDRVDGGIG